MKPRRPLVIRRFTDSFQHALEGVLDAYRSQRHMRVHFFAMAINALLALVYKLSAVETALLIVVITMVVVAEMLNTVIEATLNMITETYHPIARFVKDVAAGSVLVTAVSACLVGVCIYFHPERLARVRLVWITGEYVDNSAMLRALAMSLLLLLVIITALKVGRPRGSVLRGGVVSGQTAFAFCCATSLAFLIRQTTFVYLAVTLAVLIAGLVAYARVQDHTQRIRTVFYGIVLGIAVPLLVFGLLARPTL